MRLTRYLSRRLLRFLQYLFVGVLVVLMIPILLNKNIFPDKGNDVGDRLGQAGIPHDLPGMIVAPDSDKPGEIRDSNINLGPVDPKDPSARFRDLPKDRDWQDYAEIKKDQARTGPGERGRPVVLPKDTETQKLEDKIYRVNGFDGLVSDKISLNRSIKDIRHPGCKNKKYLRRLPTVTVILPFHNEHNSTLLRSVYSVINRSPPEILKEIVLVDDASTKEFLKAPLQDFLNKVGLASMVKVVRAKKREGLIRARQIGAQHATSEIMVFLDSHSEPNYNWLPPLIEPIALDYRTAVCPFVDVIDCDTFEYRAQDEGARGSFDWEFNYKRLPLQPEDLKDPTRPFNSPVMAGGYFAISRQWFWELGGYDEGLDIWGGEQYELSFKIWQCHGKLVDSACSRVGHIYRCKYVPFPNPGVGDFISRNYKRVAEVWMDEYKEHLFKRRTSLKDTDPGDLSKQKAVRERLKCKSFGWFMKEIAFDQDKFYPAVEPPDGASGEVRNKKAKKCIDSQFKGKEERFGLRTCITDSRDAGGEQNMRMSFWKDIRPMQRSMCFDVSSSVKQAPVVLFPCHGMGGNQQWKYRVMSEQLYHSSGQCLDCDPERGELFMNPCDNGSETQKWSWEHLNKTVIDSWKY